MADLGAGQGIWQVSADGTGLHEVFTAPAGTGLDDGPAFTPDGKHIIFTRCYPEGFGYSLWVINSDAEAIWLEDQRFSPRSETEPRNDFAVRQMTRAQGVTG